MTSDDPAEPQSEALEPEEIVDGLPVLAAEVRALEPLARRQLPAVQVAAVAATSFVAGAATVVAVRHRVKRGRPSLARAKRAAGAETLSVLGTRSFLLDVHLLGRGE
jgi:hypothetical protein